MSPNSAGVGPGDGAARVAVPDGWAGVEPGDGETQALAVTAWDPALGPRPTMTVRMTPPASEPVAAQVLAEAEATLPELHVVSIDPWTVPGTTAPGRRLVLAHPVGDLTVTTLVWTVTTAAGDVVVTARVPSTSLHDHDRAFAEAVAGIRLPAEPATSAHPHTADLAGRPAAGSWDAAVAAADGVRPGIVADPHARIVVEASVGAASLRFDATLARDHATVSATASPRAVAGGVAGAVDGGAGSGLDGGLRHQATAFRIPVARLSLAIARWLDLRPAWTAATEPVTLPISLVMSRLRDPRTAAPPGVDATTWGQPWFLWTLRSSATDSGLVMVDAGTSGQCAVMETDDETTTRFAPVTSYNVWLTLNWLIAESLVR